MSGPLYSNVLLFVLNIRTLISLDRVGNDTSSSRDEEGRIRSGTLSGLSLDHSGIVLVKVTMNVLKQFKNGKVSYSFQGRTKTDVPLGRFGGARE